MIEVTDEVGLKKQLKAHNRVLVLFHASWCPFCRSFTSVFNKQARTPGETEYIKVRIDDDDNPLWEIYSLEAVPSLILFEQGQLVKRLDCELGTGLDERQFTNWLGAP